MPKKMSSNPDIYILFKGTTDSNIQTMHSPVQKALKTQ